MSVITAAAGFTFKADIFCPACIVPAMAATPEYEGWGLAEGVDIEIEENLDEMAAAFGVDRDNEYSFDSDEFPKPISADQANGEACSNCGDEI